MIAVPFSVHRLVKVVYRVAEAGAVTAPIKVELALTDGPLDARPALTEVVPVAVGPAADSVDEPL